MHATLTVVTLVPVTIVLVVRVLVAASSLALHVVQVAISMLCIDSKLFVLICLRLDLGRRRIAYYSSSSVCVPVERLTTVGAVVIVLVALLKIAALSVSTTAALVFILATHCDW